MRKFNEVFPSGLTSCPAAQACTYQATLKQDVPSEAVAEAALASGVRVFPMPQGIVFGIGAIEASQIKIATEKLRDGVSRPATRNFSLEENECGRETMN